MQTVTDVAPKILLPIGERTSRTATEYPCPGCGTMLKMEPHPTDPNRLVGRCHKCSSGRRVIEFNIQPEPILELTLETELVEFPDEEEIEE